MTLRSVLLLLVSGFLCAYAQLSFDYYKQTCPEVVSIVKNVMRQKIKDDHRMGASILRMQFHDCFVEGCDASVLIDSTPGNVAEKDFAANNPSLRGFEVIDAAKALVEKQCPNTVSCADIIALAGRSGVELTVLPPPFATQGPSWDLRLGRKDGRVSKSENARASLPAPFFNLQQLVASFAAKGLDEKDLVTLSGGHTIGFSHCSSFSNRLYNFTGKGDQDPALNQFTASFLKGKCPRGSPDNRTLVPIDASPLMIDSQYYRGLSFGQGLFSSDSALLTSPFTRKQVTENFKRNVFLMKFSAAMTKMSEIQVKTEGEVRKNCHRIN